MQESPFQWGNLEARGNRISKDFHLFKQAMGRCSVWAILRIVNTAWGPHTPADQKVSKLGKNGQVNPQIQQPEQSPSQYQTTQTFYPPTHLLAGGEAQMTEVHIWIEQRCCVDKFWVPSGGTGGVTEHQVGEGGADLFHLGSSDRTHRNGLKLHQESFR